HFGTNVDKISNKDSLCTRRGLFRLAGRDVDCNGFCLNWKLAREQEHITNRLEYRPVIVRSQMEIQVADGFLIHDCVPILRGLKLLIRKLMKRSGYGRVHQAAT